MHRSRRRRTGVGDTRIEISLRSRPLWPASSCWSLGAGYGEFALISTSQADTSGSQDGSWARAITRLKRRRLGGCSPGDEHATMALRRARIGPSYPPGEQLPGHHRTTQDQRLRHRRAGRPVRGGRARAGVSIYKNGCCAEAQQRHLEHSTPPTTFIQRMALLRFDLARVTAAASWLGCSTACRSILEFRPPAKSWTTTAGFPGYGPVAGRAPRKRIV